MGEPEELPAVVAGTDEEADDHPSSTEHRQDGGDENNGALGPDDEGVGRSSKRCPRGDLEGWEHGENHIGDIVLSSCPRLRISAPDDCELDAVVGSPSILIDISSCCLDVPSCLHLLRA